MLLADKIKYAREKRGWTQEELAYKAAISVKSIQRVENHIQISLKSLESIAAALGVDYDYLLDERQHLADIKREFSNQAQFIDNSKMFNRTDIIDQIVLKSNVKQNDMVLDLACGTGIITKSIANKSKSIYAVDITDKMVSVTKEMCESEEFNHIHVLKGNAEKLNFQNDFFDLIITRLSIHHFKNPDIVIKEMKRVLKDSGRIIIVDIYSSGILEEAELHNAIEKLRDPTHVKALSLDEFEELFEQNSLCVKSIETIETAREYEEWLKITNAPERYEPLHIILKNLIACNKRAGIELTLSNEKIHFKHRFAIFELCFA